MSKQCEEESCEDCILNPDEDKLDYLSGRTKMLTDCLVNVSDAKWSFTLKMVESYDDKEIYGILLMGAMKGKQPQEIMCIYQIDNGPIMYVLISKPHRSWDKVMKAYNAMLKTAQEKCEKNKDIQSRFLNLNEADEFFRKELLPAIREAKEYQAVEKSDVREMVHSALNDVIKNAMIDVHKKIDKIIEEQHAMAEKINDIYEMVSLAEDRVTMARDEIEAVADSTTKIDDFMNAVRNRVESMKGLYVNE